ncbi:MAG: putative Alpha/beta hydrolase fold protein [Solirubrobacterales bacterium]|nr:putative Alpha/beta hydrolase fold protein [Solirubrobacterales bacterium]
MPYALRRPRLHYERTGRGEPLLCITGFTISSAVYEPVLPLWSREFDCITYDNRGSGRSDAPLRTTSMAELAADAARLLDALGVASAHVFGISMGGMIAQELALRFPEKVRGLVLAGTTPGGPRAVRPALAELAAVGVNLASTYREPGRPWLAPLLFSERFRAEQPARVAELLESFAAHGPTPWGANAHWWATVYHDTGARLVQVQAPTLVLHGGEDTFAPLANARFMASRIPRAELAVVPGTGHAFLLEAPGETLALMKDFLERHGPIAPGRPRTGLAARAEPLTRAFGLPIGALRTGGSLAALAASPFRSKRS